MKTSDNFFRGFPAVWNLVAFYLLLLRPAPALIAAAVALFAVLTFVPIRFVHPFRVRRLRAVTVALLTLWAALALAAVRQGLAPELWITAACALIAVYFLGCRGVAAPRSDTHMTRHARSADRSQRLGRAGHPDRARDRARHRQRRVHLGAGVRGLPATQAKRARQIGLSLALIFRIALLFALTALMKLRYPVMTILGNEISWHDIILIGGGLFLIAKATHEIHDEIEQRHGDDGSVGRAGRRLPWSSSRSS